MTNEMIKHAIEEETNVYTILECIRNKNGEPDFYYVVAAIYLVDVDYDKGIATVSDHSDLRYPYTVDFDELFETESDAREELKWI